MCLDALWRVREKTIASLSATGRYHLPGTPRARMELVVQHEGSTKKAAQLLGVHPETVRRYLRGQRQYPPAAFAARLESQARIAYRPRLGRQADQQMIKVGLRVNLTARFGFSGSNGSSDDPRERQLSEDLTSADTARLLAARDAGSEQDARDITAEGAGQAYFQLRGTGMSVEMNDLIFVSYEA
jgi:hypothetical protein